MIMILDQLREPGVMKEVCWKNENEWPFGLPPLFALTHGQGDGGLRWRIWTLKSIFQAAISSSEPAGLAPAFSWTLENSGADSSALRASWRKRSRASRVLRKWHPSPKRPDTPRL